MPEHVYVLIFGEKHNLPRVGIKPMTPGHTLSPKLINVSVWLNNYSKLVQFGR